MKIQDLIDRYRGELLRAQDDKAKAIGALTDLRAAEVAGQVVDAAGVEAWRSRKADAEQRITSRAEQIARLEAERDADDEATRAQSTITPTNVRRPSYDGVARVTSEARTYERPSAYRSDAPSFLADLYAAQIKRDPAASERLARHGREVEADDPMWSARAVGTGAVSGFVPPQYLVDEWAEYARAGRPTADACTRLPLPESGMSLVVPRITTPTIVASQSAENAAVANQDIDDTLLTVNVVTIAGYVDVSRQAIERGQLVEQVILGDLSAAYNTELDRQVLNGSGAAGQHLGILNTVGVNAVTYTDATPTMGELWPKLASAAGQVMSQRFAGPTHIIVSPSEWAWLLSSLDTTGRPLIGADQPLNGLGSSGEHPFTYTAGGATLMGARIIVDGNMPANLGAGTNETRIVAADLTDCLLFEDNNGAPKQLRFEEVLSSTLGVRLLAYGYSAFTAGRQPKAVSVIAGTGLITPAL